MKQEIKNKILKFLNESEDHVHIDPSVVGPISDVKIDKAEDYIRIDFNTTYGKAVSLLTKYGRFKNWYTKFKDKFANPFKAYVQAYLEASEEQKQELVGEIVDGDGNLYGDGDIPPNGPGKMVGTSVWDLEKVYRSSNVRPMRSYSGDLGIGIITW